MVSVNPEDRPSVDSLVSGSEPVSTGTDEYRLAFNESLDQTLNLDTWSVGENLAALYSRFEQEIDAAIQQEDGIRDSIRKEVFPRIGTGKNAPATAGVYQASVQQIEQVHRGLLFNGAVEACDGTSVVHDTLPITIAQIGVCLVSYAGDQGSWVHHLYRRDLRVSGLDPVEEALEMLERRERRAGYDMVSQRDKLTDLARRGIMTYAERAVLLHRSDAPWRMGHGNPMPYELLTGSGMPKLADASVDLLDDLIFEHRKFVFVPSAPSDRTFLTIGNSLYPLEYAIINTLEDNVGRILAGHYRGADWEAIYPRLEKFAKEASKQVIVGVFRASSLAPPQVFYAHADHAHEAALIALADSTLQEDRGFPMLIDLADTVCGATFGGSAFTATTQLAYAEAGEPFRYLTERSTRR